MDATNGIKSKLIFKYGFGSHVTPLDGIQSFSSSAAGKDISDKVIYKIGKQVCVYDPEKSKQTFFESRSKAVTDVLHFSISSNSRYISMCEIIRHDKIIDSVSHISIYSLNTMNKLKTLTCSPAKIFICSTFCGDPKMVAALSEEPDRLIMVWHWEKEKLHKSIPLFSIIPTLLRSSPSNGLMLTTSGIGHLKSWYIGGDGNFKSGNFLAASKENNEKFIDHVWLHSNLGLHKMVALTDPDYNGNVDNSVTATTATSNTRGRKQLIYIFEGNDLNTVGSATALNTNSGTIPISMDLKQTIAIRLDPGARMEKIVQRAKAFMLIGSQGLICQYERTDEKHDPYIESRRLSIGEVHLVAGTVYPSEEKLFVVSKAGRILSIPLDMNLDQLKIDLSGEHRTGGGSTFDDDGSSRSINSDEVGNSNPQNGITDLTSGGFHTSTILTGDAALERPLLVTIASDNTARVWNYVTCKCELVHYFRNDEALTVAFHPAGFQILVSFKDRIRMFNVLMDKLKPYKETILKNCKVLKFSYGAQYWAAASAINVCVYDTRTFQQLMNFQGHMMTVVRLHWAIGDQVLFSAGMDGNVYGWTIAREGRLDVVPASNRSSAILDMIVDGPSTVFKVAPKDPSDVEDDAIQIGGSLSARGGGTAREVGSSIKGGSGRGGTASSNSSNASNDGNSSLSAEQQQQLTLARSCLIISSLDGYLKFPPWSIDVIRGVSNNTVSNGNRHSNFLDHTTMMIPGDSSLTITCMQLSSDRTKLFAGTNHGSVRIYSWPPVTLWADGAAQNPSAPGTSGGNPSNNLLNYAYTEIFSHAGTVVALRLSALENVLVTAGSDGCIFIHSIVDINAILPSSMTNGMGLKMSSTDSADMDISLDDPFDMGSDKLVLNTEVVMISTEDIDEHVTEIVELQKLLHETKTKNDFQTRKLESEHGEGMKKLHEVHDATLIKEKENFERQRIAFDKRIRELMSGMEGKDLDHIKVMTELENKYEHKMADQLERYDQLSEKMTLLKQKCEGLLESEKKNFSKQLSELKDEVRTRESKINKELKRALDDKQANDSAYKEIINQQEDEYEDELRQLISAAESELVSERDTIMKLRTLVQTKNTKLDQLKKKMMELSIASKARLQLLNIERQEKQKLLDTIEHYKKNLIEREDALAEKEKLVIELRSTTRTLENFRFVLDHRLQQLSSERGPITSHIEGLERHISTMYEELVEEFTLKKSMGEASNLKDQKLMWLTQDLTKVRQSIREKEVYIASFKTELTNIISSMAVGKELEEAVKLLYKKFVKGEAHESSFVKLSAPAVEKVHEILDDDDNHSMLSADSLGKVPLGSSNMHGMNTKTLIKDVEEALVESAKEADRQKKFMEKKSTNLQHRLEMLKDEAQITAHRRLQENSKLLYECNELRKEVKQLHQKLESKKNDLDLANRKLSETQDQLIRLNTTMNSAINQMHSPLGGTTHPFQNVLSPSAMVPTATGTTTATHAMVGNKNKKNVKSVDPSPAIPRSSSSSGGTPLAPLKHSYDTAGLTLQSAEHVTGEIDRSSSHGQQNLHEDLPDHIRIDAPNVDHHNAFANFVINASESAASAVVDGLQAAENERMEFVKSDSLNDLNIQIGSPIPIPSSKIKKSQGGSSSRSTPNLSKSLPIPSPFGLKSSRKGTSSEVNLERPELFIGSIMPTVAGLRGISRQNISLNLPRAESMKDSVKDSISATKSFRSQHSVSGGHGGGGARLGGMTGMSEIQADKLYKEVDSLANQLDESQRERELQRLELNRLRKQVATMINGNNYLNNQNLHSIGHSVDLNPPGGGGVGGSQLSFSPSASTTQLPSIGGSIGNQNSQIALGIIHQHLTNADIRGVPSEQDRLDMRLEPTGQSGGGGSRKGSIRKISRQNSSNSRNSLRDRNARQSVLEEPMNDSTDLVHRDGNDISLHSGNTGGLR